MQTQHSALLRAFDAVDEVEESCRERQDCVTVSNCIGGQPQPLAFYLSQMDWRNARRMQ